MQVSDALEPGKAISFKSESLSAVLVERLEYLGDKVPWKSEVKVRTLVHGQSPALDLCDNAGPKIAALGTEEYRAAQAELEGFLT